MVSVRCCGADCWRQSVRTIHADWLGGMRGAGFFFEIFLRRAGLAVATVPAWCGAGITAFTRVGWAPDGICMAGVVAGVVSGVVAFNDGLTAGAKLTSRGL